MVSAFGLSIFPSIPSSELFSDLPSLLYSFLMTERAGFETHFRVFCCGGPNFRAGYLRYAQSLHSFDLGDRLFINSLTMEPYIAVAGCDRPEPDLEGRLLSANTRLFCLRLSTVLTHEGLGGSLLSSGQSQFSPLEVQ